MEKVTLDIVEKGNVCELKKPGKGKKITDDCEKVLYLALAEGQKQPTQILIKASDGTVKRTIFVPEKLHVEELKKRETLIELLGNFLKEVIQLPEEVYSIYHKYTDIDELYDHLIFLLEAKGWGQSPEQAEKKFDRGDEIEKRETIVHLTADFLKIYGLVTPNMVADFYRFPDQISIDELTSGVNKLISQKDSEVVIIYVVDNPNSEEEFPTDLLPVFIEEEGHLKITAWIAPDVIPQNLLPVFDIEQNLIGWLDANKEQGADN